MKTLFLIGALAYVPLVGCVDISLFNHSRSSPSDDQALALPSPNLRSDYMLLKQVLEKQHPDYWCVFINENEQLLMPKKDGFIHVKSNGTDKEFLHIWLLKRDA